MRRTKKSTKLRAIAAAVLTTISVASLVGIALTASAAGAAPLNLVANGSFEATTSSPFLVTPVLAGDSTTIPGWTVVTPSFYGGSNGSVDLVSRGYWNPEDGNYSVDLAGSTGTPGGIYQTVTTVPGDQYSLSYWSAVNGDAAPGSSHDLDVTLNGTLVATVEQAGVGRPLHWVQHTVTVTADSGSSRIEFDDLTPGDTNQGPTIDNVSFTAISGGAATCTSAGCSGSVTTTLQTVSFTSTSTTGTILTTVDPAGSISCGDSFRHAPEATTVTDSGLNANILYTVTFKNRTAAGPWFVPFAVCYQAQTPFKDLYGHTVTIGLLPRCSAYPRRNGPPAAPCVESITERPFYLGNVVEKIVVPPGDPRFH